MPQPRSTARPCTRGCWRRARAREPVRWPHRLGRELGRAGRGDGTGPSARRVYLAPGRLYASAEADQVTTILGSCVAVCLWDPQVRVGGVNHFLLPEGVPPSPRFGQSAVPLLIESVLDLGACRRAPSGQGLRRGQRSRSLSHRRPVSRGPERGSRPGAPARRAHRGGRGRRRWRPRPEARFRGPDRARLDPGHRRQELIPRTGEELRFQPSVAVRRRSPAVVRSLPPKRGTPSPAHSSRRILGRPQRQGAALDRVVRHSLREMPRILGNPSATRRLAELFGTPFGRRLESGAVATSREKVSLMVNRRPDGPSVEREILRPSPLRSRQRGSGFRDDFRETRTGQRSTGRRAVECNSNGGKTYEEWPPLANLLQWVGCGPHRPESEVGT